MAAPTNISAATATELGPLPNSISQRVDDAGTTYTVWFKITTALAGMIGPWAFGDLVVYKPSLHIYESDGITPVVNDGLGASPNKRMQFPSVASTYFLKVVPNGGNPSPANLTISALYFTELDPTPVPGSILTNDDDAGMPALLMNAAGTPRKFLYGMANGESGSILPSGRFILTRDDEPGVTSGEANIYNADCSVRTTFRINNELTNSLLLLTGASARYFYTLDTNTNHAAPYPVQRVTEDGTILSNIWDVGPDVLGIAPSRDDTVLYYANLTNTVKRWDLVNNVALADLYTLPAGYIHQFGSLLVLSDGSILIGANHAAPTVAHKVFRINAAGVLLNTYDLTYAGFTLNRIALNTGDTALSVWAWSRNPSTGVSRYQEVDTTGGGSILSTFDITEYESGVYLAAATATPTLEFGPSLSCPFLVLRQGQSGTIIVQKVTDPDSDTDTEFGFTADGLTPSTFTLKNGESRTFTSVPVGTYGIAETTIPSGWSLTSAETDTGDPVSAIVLADQATVTATFTNQQVTAPAGSARGLLKTGLIHVFGYQQKRPPTPNTTSEPLGLHPLGRLDTYAVDTEVHQLTKVNVHGSQPFANPSVADQNGYFSEYVVPAPIDIQIAGSRYTLPDYLVLDPRVLALIARVYAVELQLGPVVGNATDTLEAVQALGTALPLGGSLTTGVQASAVTDALNAVTVVLSGGDVTGFTATALVVVKTDDPGTSVTPVLYNVDTDEVVGTGTASVSTTGEVQAIAVTLDPATTHYRLRLIPSNAGSFVYGTGYLFVSR